MTDKARWILAGIMAGTLLLACESPTNPKFPNEQDEEDHGDPDPGDDQASLFELGGALLLT